MGINASLLKCTFKKTMYKVHFLQRCSKAINMAKKNSKSFGPPKGSLPWKNQAWGTKEIFWKTWFSHFDRLEKLTRWSCLFFYLLRTRKYPEMFLMPFFVEGPLNWSYDNLWTNLLLSKSASGQKEGFNLDVFSSWNVRLMCLNIRYHSRFFVQVGHETTYAWTSLYMDGTAINFF